MNEFFNFIFSKETFNGIATIIAGAFAFIVYTLHKRDEKIKASRIILLEIRNAEDQILNIKNTGVASDFSSILPFDNWQNYNHLFVKDFDIDETKSINNFYISCALVDKELNRLKNFLPLAMENKAAEIQTKLLELADRNKNDHNTYKKEKDLILDTIHKETYYFEAISPKEKIIQYLKNIQLITVTTVGAKIKKIANFN